jgi:hypothetical protein
MAGANREAIEATLDLLAEVSNSVSISVPLADFADWLEALGQDTFHVCRREDAAGLHVFAKGYRRNTFVSFDAGAEVVDVIGHVVPPRDAAHRFLDLPSSEVANLRAGGR